MNAHVARSAIVVCAALALGVIATLFWDSGAVTMPPLHMRIGLLFVKYA
jgi:hypothetical protein